MNSGKCSALTLIAKPPEERVSSGPYVNSLCFRSKPPHSLFKSGKSRRRRVFQRCQKTSYSESVSTDVVLLRFVALFNLAWIQFVADDGSKNLRNGSDVWII